MVVSYENEMYYLYKNVRLKRHLCLNIVTNQIHQMHQRECYHFDVCRTHQINRIHQSESRLCVNIKYVYRTHRSGQQLIKHTIYIVGGDDI